MRRLTTTLVALLAVSTQLVAPVLAQPAPQQPAADKTEAAKQYVNAAIAAQNTHDYDTALQLYEKAYALVPHPTLIFNMAQAHRLAGHTDKALALYAEYLEKDPNGPQAQTARDVVKEITDKRAADKKAADDAKAAQLKQAQDDAKAAQLKRAQDDAARKIVDKPPPPVEPPPAPVRPGRPLRIGGLVCGGAGVVSLGVGIGFALHARSLSNELSENMAVYSQDKVDRGERANVIGISGIVVGAALVGTGAFLYWRGTNTHETQPLAFAPYATSEGAGFAIGGSL
ncbi:MAG TPA: tetratricopeptide repeat protein [Kofleriaceae bacterium]|jgi:tetratricopeptide (TPR) repeat protein